MPIPLEFVNNLSLLLALSILYSFFARRWGVHTSTGRVFAGVLFGGVAVAGMLNPIAIAPGVLFDGRSVILSMSGVFGGPVTAAVAAGIACWYRIWLGGTGAVAGVIVAVISAALGSGYYFLRRKDARALRPVYLYGFGVLVHLCMIGCMLALPRHLALEVLTRVFLPVLLIFPAGTVMLGKLLSDVERKVAMERTLRESEERHTELVDHMRSGLAVFGVSGDGTEFVVLELNRTGARLSGVDQERVRGASAREVFPWMEEEGMLRACRRVWETGTSEFFPMVPCGDRHGRSLWNELDVYRVPTGEVVVVYRDITERIHAEGALHKTRSLLEGAIDNAPIGIALIRPDGVFARVNEAFRELTGYDAHELRSMSIMDITHPDDAGTDSEFAVPFPGVCRKSAFEKRYLHKTGRVIHVYVTTVLLRDEGGHPLYFFAHAQDITARKVAEAEVKRHRERLEERVVLRTRELEEKTKRLEESQRALTYLVEDVNESREELERVNRELESEIRERKGTEDKLQRYASQLEEVNEELKSFAYIASHDLKAPLRAVSQLAYWISHDYRDMIDEKGAELLMLLRGRVERMDRLINGILQYSRIGRVQEKKRHLDLQVLVREVIDALGPQEGITVTVDGPLPRVVADRTRMEQVFQNLLSNAVKFMDKPVGEVRVGCTDEETHWNLYVADNGPGIDPKYHKKVFQIFQTLSLHDDPDSSGIGLTVAEKIIRLYGGRIWLESGPGRGLTVFFTLPKEAPEQETAPEADTPSCS